MFRFFEKYDRIVETTLCLLKEGNVKISPAIINDLLKNHPYYPALLSISDVLKQLHVSNIALKIEAENLKKIPVPFISYIGRNKLEPIVITAIEDGKVTYKTNISTKEVSLTKENFLAQWNEVVLVSEFRSEDINHSSMTTSIRNRINRHFAFILFGVLFFSALVSVVKTSSPQLHNASLIFGVLSFLKFAGVVVSTLLLWYEIDKSAPVLQSICTSIKKSNCNAILSSDKAKVFSWLSWSEVGFFYFMGGLFTLIFFSDVSSSLVLLALLNLFTIPYIVFSVYYQGFVIKQWCALCLLVQTILSLELMSSLIFYDFSEMNFDEIISFRALFYLFNSFLIPVLGWAIIKPLLYKNEQNKSSLRGLQRIKFNSTVFKHLLSEQKKINIPAGLGIILGNKDGSDVLLKVCGPYCNPCSKAHGSIEKLTEHNKNLKVQIIFLVNPDMRDPKTFIAKHLLSLQENEDELILKKALHAWYNEPKKDYEAFRQQYKLKEPIEKQDDKLISMVNWCKDFQITFTPSLFLNGFQLPSEYTVDDLNYLLSDN